MLVTGLKELMHRFALHGGLAAKTGSLLKGKTSRVTGERKHLSAFLGQIGDNDYDDWSPRYIVIGSLFDNAKKMFLRKKRLTVFQSAPGTRTLVTTPMRKILPITWHDCVKH